MITETAARDDLIAILTAPVKDDRAIATACRILNSIKLTVDQFNRGVQAYDEVYANTPKPHGQEVRAMARDALKAFCESEGLLPAEVAVEAILIRRRPIEDMLYEARQDIRKTNPRLYEDCITRTIHHGYFRMLKANEIDESGDIIPLPF